ncbi:hypothetical protein H2201_008735 [Coniosporium apollinis]|uniref:Transcription factor domain-containing protein n=2 Tax=Coniosporium TaxID=2810619 RepID=A0ABQ9NHE1_9PEZI|nr:hypothetical protein H2199_005359 [Cladosporium sp. JES 115]KAJ9655773.1 hypothetical protein H2201_008735 [Coniosporium apollinis]
MYLPFGTPTYNDTTAWHPEPTFRGTFSILSSCIITLVLEARKLDEDMRAAFGEPPMPTLGRRLSRLARRGTGAEEVHQEDIEASYKPAIFKRKHPWTFVHSLYAVMGGIAFDVSNAERKFLPDDLTRLTLTPTGLLYLAQKRPSLVPDISLAKIQDKSKANNLAKTLVCLQVLWFCFHYIARAVQRLPISLLELNTLAHALCALLTYILWWRKPLDVEGPTLIADEKAHPFCALMCLTSGVGAHCHDWTLRNGFQQAKLDHPQSFFGSIEGTETLLDSIVVRYPGNDTLQLDIEKLLSYYVTDLKGSSRPD